MKRRFGRDDFKSASPFEKEARGGTFFWRVFEEFDIVAKEKQFPYFEASSYEGSKIYEPFVDTPHLFLEFARIAEQKGHQYEALDHWISRYGLLGLSREHPDWVVEPLPEVEWTQNRDVCPEVYVPPLTYSYAGGPGDTLYAYRLEAAKTNKILTLYEALLSQDGEGLERCFALHERCTPEDLRAKWRGELEESIEKNASLNGRAYVVMEILDDMVVYDSMPSDWNAFLADRALRDIWWMVGSALSIFAYPSISVQATSAHPKGELSPEKVTSTWRVRNLLGAIYLQFYWLITSMSDLSRCKYCGRIISYAPSMPESGRRKPRKDKEFCDSRCRQNYHYHNRIKPSRNPA
jgi:hypothetical protein